MDNKHETTGESEMINNENTGWESVAAMADRQMGENHETSTK